MKTRISVVLACLVLVAPIGLTGCGSTPVQTVIKTNSVLIVTVHQGMLAWADYVRAGHATQNQVDTVKKAYNAYYDAEMILKATLEKVLAANATATQADIDTANAAVNVAESSLISLLNQFIFKA